MCWTSTGRKNDLHTLVRRFCHETATTRTAVVVVFSFFRRCYSSRLQLTAATTPPRPGTTLTRGLLALVGARMVVLRKSHGGAVRGHKEVCLRRQIYASSCICHPTLCSVDMDPKKSRRKTMTGLGTGPEPTGSTSCPGCRGGGAGLQDTGS